MRVKFAAIGLALLALLGISTASATSDRGSGAANRLDLVLHRGMLKVCSTGDYRPFTHYDPATSQWSGIDIDLAKDLATRLGVQMTVVPTTWRTLMDDFVRNCDIAMGGVSLTLDRAKRAFFSTAYLRDGKTPITRCENVDRFQTLQQIDQPGVRAIVNPGGTNEQFANANLKQATIIRHPDNHTIFQEIIAGRADLMITDAVETRWQAKQHPQLCAVHPDQPFTFSEKAYLLPRGDMVFHQWVNHWLHMAKNDGTYDRIAKPWLG